MVEKKTVHNGLLKVIVHKENLSLVFTALVCIWGPVSLMEAHTAASATKAIQEKTVKLILMNVYPTPAKTEEHALMKLTHSFVCVYQAMAEAHVEKIQKAAIITGTNSKDLVTDTFLSGGHGRRQKETVEGDLATSQVSTLLRNKYLSRVLVVRTPGLVSMTEQWNRTSSGQIIQHCNMRTGEISSRITFFLVERTV